MGFDGLEQVGGAAVVEEEDAFTDSPERGGAEFGGRSVALGDAIIETVAHGVELEVGERGERAVGLAGEDGRGGCVLRDMAGGAPDVGEDGAAVES